ncbi:hypothetical protein NMG60_11014624 [Bertholletia excelsa]
MDVSVQYADLVKEGLAKPNDWGQLWSNCKQGSNRVENFVAEIGSALEDALVLLSTTAPPMERCKVGCLEWDKECGMLTVSQDESMTVTSEKALGRNTTLHCSGNMLLCGVPVTEQAETSNTVWDGHNPLESSDNSSNTVKPLSTSLKLVSAMKGSREKRGLDVEKLTVSWAPDVYDPPVTSQSHTVNRHSQHYSMTSKKSYRNKQKHRAKSSQNGSTNKKQHRKTVRGS